MLSEEGHSTTSLMSAFEAKVKTQAISGGSGPQQEGGKPSQPAQGIRKKLHQAEKKQLQRVDEAEEVIPRPMSEET